jgi:hypothetical protein
MPTRMAGIYAALFITTVMFTLAGCRNSSDGLGASLLVTVSADPNHALSNVTVVLGDSNGTMKTYGTTDAHGQITFYNAPADATVTAAFSCLHPGAAATTNSLDVRYDVNGPVTLHVNGCLPSSGSSTGSSDLGTATLNVTNGINGITQNEVSTSSQRHYPGVPGLITRQTITISQYDLQSDGKLSLFVVGKDANGAPLGYGYLLDQTFTDGMTVNITVDKPMSYLQYQIANLPSTAGSLCPDIYQGRAGKGGLWLFDCQSLSSAATSTTINVPYMPGFGDQFLYSANVYTFQYAGNTSVFSSQYLSPGPYASTLSNQNFDFSQALAAPNLTISGTNTPTPTLSWTGVDPDATMISFFAYFELSSASPFYFSIYDMSHTRTSITFPELPDSLAAFRPTAVKHFSVDTMATDGGLYRSSEGSYSNF